MIFRSQTTALSLHRAFYLMGHCFCFLLTLKSPCARAASDQTDGKAFRSDIRDLAPRRPASFGESGRAGLAIPQSGNTLSSVSQNWFTQQAHLMTNGGDQRFLDQINRSLASTFGPDPSEDATCENPDVTTAKPLSNSPVLVDKSDSFTQKLRFAALNRIEFALAPQTRLNCSIEGSNLRFDLSQPIGKDLDLNFRYESASGSNTVRFHYNW